MFKCTACGFTKSKLDAAPEYQLRRTATGSEENGEVLCVSDNCSFCQRLTFFAQFVDSEAVAEAELEEPPQESVSKKTQNASARSLRNVAEERVSSTPAIIQRTPSDTPQQRLHGTEPLRAAQKWPVEPTTTFRGLATMPMPPYGSFNGDGERQETPERFPSIRKGRGVSAAPEISHPCASPPKRTPADVTIHYRKECCAATGAVPSAGHHPEQHPHPHPEPDSESRDDLSVEQDVGNEMESLDTLHRRHNCCTSSSSGSSGTESAAHGENRNTGGLHRISGAEYFKLPSFRSVIQMQQTKMEDKQQEIRQLDRFRLQVQAEMKKIEMELQELENEPLQLEHTARKDRKKRHTGGAHGPSKSPSIVKAKELKRLFGVSSHCQDKANARADALLSSLVKSLQEQTTKGKDQGTQTDPCRHKKTNNQERAHDKSQTKMNKRYGQRTVGSQCASF